MPDVPCRINLSGIPPDYSDRFEPPTALQQYTTAVANLVRGDTDEGVRFDAHERLHHAAFHIRSANLAVELLDGVTSDQGSQRYQQVAASFTDTDQFAALGFGSLAITSVVSAINLCAATAYRLEVGVPERHEADVGMLTDAKRDLSEPIRKWLAEVRCDHWWRVVSQHRNEISHRSYPMHHVIVAQTVRPVSIGGQRVGSDDDIAGPTRHVPHSVEVGGRRYRIDELAVKGLSVGVRALVSLCALLRDRYSPTS